MRHPSWTVSNCKNFKSFYFTGSAKFSATPNRTPKAIDSGRNNVQDQKNTGPTLYKPPTKPETARPTVYKPSAPAPYVPPAKPAGPTVHTPSSKPTPTVSYQPDPRTVRPAGPTLYTPSQKPTPGPVLGPTLYTPGMVP